MSECLFCQIITRKISSKVEFENDAMIAIQDVNPQAPTHVLVIPKKHIGRISDTDGKDALLIGDLILCARDLARRKGLEEGYRLVFNNGPEAGQSVFHIHLHLLGGRRMWWPPG
ncbi:MAG: histidine triad nucleotide-binding protein [Omnitrophica bacterium RIFCSPLOWO2_12_FULL_50_11]|nr:MAG: histidine triad nucleotide-binding protein [Omnitrophica bacterium RIFCSPLOWO2_12_FULL_50_11]